MLFIGNFRQSPNCARKSSRAAHGRTRGREPIDMGVLPPPVRFYYDEVLLRGLWIGFLLP